VIPFVIGVVATLVLLMVIAIGGLIHQCPPNQLLVFSGIKSTRVGSRRYGYRLVRSTLGVQTPFLERVDSIDLTNMIIELSVTGAYGKGGVAVNVYGVANVKIASHEPLIHNAIERFLGKGRAEIMQMAKVTLEGSLRGVLATLTPEQLNEDRELFREKVVAEADQDMTTLGLVVDTLRIQNITDDMKYLDSIGRIRNAELLSSARVAEAIARADASVRSSENNEREIEARILADISITAADGEKLLKDATTRRAAVVAEEEAKVAALVAKARADLSVQRARVEQVRKQLEADVIAPAKARCEAMEQEAKAEVASIVEEGRARAEALTNLAASWTAAGPQAREIFLIQKIEPIIRQISGTISQTSIEKYTVLSSPTGTGGGLDAAKLAGMNAQVKEVFGIDIVEKLKDFGAKPSAAEPESLPLNPPPIAGRE
jgi:flotillin